MKSDLNVLPEYQQRLVKRAQRSISTGSIPTDVVEELIDALVTVWQWQREKDEDCRKQILDLEDAVVRLGGGSGADRRRDREPPQRFQQGGWVDA